MAQAERATYIAELLQCHSIVPVLALVMPYAVTRAGLAGRLPAGCLEIYLRAPLEVCISRDSHRTYSTIAARGGDVVREVVDPYEVPRRPALALDTAARSIDQCVESIVEAWQPLSSASRS
jgi:adenylylsulfate kinase-like enzyme